MRIPRAYASLTHHTHPWHMFHSSTHTTRRRAKTKVSCQKLKAYKMNAVSKKKLMAKNTKLTNKLKSKGEDRAVLVRQLKDAELTELYWQDRAARAEEELAGNASPSSTL